MGEREKKYLGIMAICTVIIIMACLCIGILECIHINPKTEKTIRYIFLVLVMVSYAVLIICVIIGLVFTWKKSIHNIRVCDIELFDDLSKVCFMANDDRGYETAYGFISYYYKSGGIVDDLVSSKQFSVLLRRYDFLKKNIGFDEALSQYIYSIFLSIVATELSGIMVEIYVSDDFFSIIFFFAKIFILILALLFLFFQRYYKRGQNGKFDYALMEYEIERLREKIDLSVNNSKMSKNDFKNNMMVYLLIHKILILDVRKHKKIKLEERKQDVTELQTLNLTMKNYKKYKYKECVIDDIVIRFYYKVDKEKTGKVYKLVNQEYEKLYTIVKKYYDIKISDKILFSIWDSF